MCMEFRAGDWHTCGDYSEEAMCKKWGKTADLFLRYGPREGVLMYIRVLVSTTLWDGGQECGWVNIH